MKTIIYYFTGTGNSLEIARQLTEKLPGAELRSFAAAYAQGGLDTDAKTVGFVFPVYFLGVPVALRALLEKTRWNPEQYIFAVANYGSMPGAALYQMETLIQQGGGRLASGHLIQMPDNYLPMFNSPTEALQTRDFKAMEQKIIPIASRIGEQKCGIEKSRFRVDQYLAGVTYPTVRKFKAMDHNYWTTGSCNGCGICSQSCPFQNLRMKDQRPEWQHHCEMCMRCIQICPQRAIQYKQGTLKKGRYLHPKVTIQDLLADGNPQGKPSGI